MSQPHSNRATHEQLVAKSAVLIAMFARAEKRVDVIMERAVASGAFLTARGRRGVLTQVSQMINQLTTEATLEARALIAWSYEQGLQTLGAVTFETPPNAASIKVFERSLNNRLNNAIKTLSSSIEDTVRRQALQSTAQAVADAQSSRRAAKALADRLAEQGRVGFRARNGARWSLEDYAKMSARTTLREAATEGMLQGMKRNGLDLIAISPGGGDDSLCAPYAGNVYSISGASAEYDLIEEYPPFHPNCTHDAYPAAENWAA